MSLVLRNCKPLPYYALHKPYLEGQGDLVSSLMRGIIKETIWVTGVLNLLTESP